MTAMHMQLRTTPQDADSLPAMTALAGNAHTGAGPDDYFSIVVRICEQAMRHHRGYLDLVEAINRLDATTGNTAPGRSTCCRPPR